MKLLIITQRVDINDDNLGFFHRWLEKFSEKLEEVYVICLWQGEHHLSQNVHVFSMGKEKGVSKIGQFTALQKHLIEILPKVNGIFVHMAPVYAIASFPLAAIFRKKMILWFVHKSVNWKLKLASGLVDKILTASEESCRLSSRKKIKIVGHGIDVESFKPVNRESSREFVIFSAGRISPVKDLETLVNAIAILLKDEKSHNVRLKIAGTSLTHSEELYFGKIKDLVRERGIDDYVEFLGSVSYAQMPKYYQDSDIFINLSHTGSIDKAVLEAMACGKPVLTCNEAFRNILPPKYFFNKKDSRDLADKIINLKEMGDGESLRETVLKYHNLDNLIIKIIAEFNGKK